jgi:antitoxin CptB
MTGTMRTSADLDERRKRILFRSWHRGMREMDLLMGKFSDARISELSDAELDDYEILIDAPDRDILGWLTGEFALPEEYNTPLFQKLKAFHTDVEKA